jgi:hypothetical protein
MSNVSQTAWLVFFLKPNHNNHNSAAHRYPLCLYLIFSTQTTSLTDKKPTNGYVLSTYNEIPKN